jgi:endothelin-converting enzyme
MDESTIKKAGTKPLLEVIDRVTELFPLTESETGMPLVLIYLNSLGLSPLVSIGAGADDKDPDVVVIQVSPPWRIGLPAKDYYENPDVLKQYKEAIAQVIAGVHPKGKDAADDVVEFEKQLAAASPNAEDAQDVTVSALDTTVQSIC